MSLTARVWSWILLWHFHQQRVTRFSSVSSPPWDFSIMWCWVRLRRSWSPHLRQRQLSLRNTANRTSSGMDRKSSSPFFIIIPLITLPIGIVFNFEIEVLSTIPTDRNTSLLVDYVKIFWSAVTTLNVLVSMPHIRLFLRSGVVASGSPNIGADFQPLFSCRLNVIALY